MADERVKCPECPNEYNSEFLQSHIKSVHKKKRKYHACGECESAFANKHYLKAHIDGVHLNKKKAKCEKCGVTCATKQALEYHDMAILGDGLPIFVHAALDGDSGEV